MRGTLEQQEDKFRIVSVERHVNDVLEYLIDVFTAYLHMQ